MLDALTEFPVMEDPPAYRNGLEPHPFFRIVADPSDLGDALGFVYASFAQHGDSFTVLRKVITNISEPPGGNFF